MPRYSVLTSIVALGVALSACGRDQRPERAPTMAAIPFDSVFRLADTITPEQPDSVPIGLISGIDFADDGSFVIADARSAQVMRYAADGTLQTRMGRHGHGPGEFQLAMFPALDEGGRIHALDFHRPRITVFNADGSFVRTVSLGHLGNRLSEVKVLPGGDYLVIALHGKTQDLLFRTDSLGTLRASYVPHGRLIPEGQPRRPVWGGARNASLATAGDVAYVVTVLSDSLWTVNLRTGTTSSQRITPPTYVSPIPPRGSLDADSAYSRWSRSWSKTMLTRTGGENVMVMFVRGILMQGDPTVIAYRGREGSWQGLTSVPIILAMRGDTAISLLDPDADTIRLGVHVRR